jgi:hypothetical protein
VLALADGSQGKGWRFQGRVQVSCQIQEDEHWQLRSEQGKGAEKESRPGPVAPPTWVDTLLIGFAPAVVEVAAAVVGAAITVGAMGVGALGSRGREGRDAVIRLAASVDNVATRLEQLHVDIKADRRETFSRLNSIEQRVARLEVTNDHV